VQQVVELFLPISLQTGIQIDVRMDPAIPETLQGDTVRVQQVLTNLLGNSFKFTRNGGITLAAHRLPPLHGPACRVLFTIADTGCGIPEDKLDELFDPFTQVSNGMRRSHQGAGLGLSICKRLVHLMGKSPSKARKARAPRRASACPSPCWPPPARRGMCRTSRQQLMDRAGQVFWMDQAEQTGRMEQAGWARQTGRTRRTSGTSGTRRE
jgi:hypothetical protein